MPACGKQSQARAQVQKHGPKTPIATKTSAQACFTLRPSSCRRRCLRAQVDLVRDVLGLLRCVRVAGAVIHLQCQDSMITLHGSAEAKRAHQWPAVRRARASMPGEGTEARPDEADHLGEVQVQMVRHNARHTFRWRNRLLPRRPRGSMPFTAFSMILSGIRCARELQHRVSVLLRSASSLMCSRETEWSHSLHDLTPWKIRRSDSKLCVSSSSASPRGVTQRTCI